MIRKNLVPPEGQDKASYKYHFKMATRVPISAAALRALAATKPAPSASDSGAAPLEIKPSRTEELLLQYRDYLLGRVPTQEQLEESVTKGFASVILDKVSTPNAIDKDGQRQRADRTHFSGLQEDGRMMDPTKGGVPKIMLAQGPRPRGSRTAVPSLLPGGQTVVDLLNKSELGQAGHVFRGVWNARHHYLEIHMIWDLPKWQAWLERRSQPQQQQQRGRGSRREQDQEDQEPEQGKTYEEWLAEQGQRQALPAPPAPRQVTADPELKVKVGRRAEKVTDWAAQ